MRLLFTILILSFPTMLLGQTWKLNKIADKGKFRYEYWLTFGNEALNKINKDLSLETNVIKDPIVYQINSKNELTDLEKERIENCIVQNPDEFHKRCSVKRKYKIYMQI
jgi:hypothetical protein